MKREIRPHRRAGGKCEGGAYRAIFYEGGEKCVSLKGWVLRGVHGHWRQMEMRGPKAERIIAWLREHGTDWQGKPTPH